MSSSETPEPAPFGAFLRRRAVILSLICILAGLAIGGIGVNKAVVEHNDAKRMEGIRDAYQKIKDDTDRIGLESPTSFGTLMAQGLSDSTQSLINQTQESIDKSERQMLYGYDLVLVALALLGAGIAIFRKRARAVPASPVEAALPAAESPTENPLDLPSNPPAPQAAGGMRNMRPLLIGGGILALLIALVALSFSSAPPPAPSTSPAAQPAPAPAPSPAASDNNWLVNSETNPVTGEVKTVASLRFQGKQNIILRLSGKNLDCYVTTDEFLETINNMESRISTVQYKFDDGKVIKQGWSISADNTALFYPGNCRPFIEQLRKAKVLAFEYRPSQKIPETITFDVSGLPEGFKVDAPAPNRAHKKSGEDATKAQ